MFVAAFAAGVKDAGASSSGIINRTNLSGGGGCGTCHSPSATLGVAFGGSLSVPYGTASGFSINISNAAALQNIGINVAVSGGTLGESVDNLQIDTGQLTHSNAIVGLNTTNNNGASSTGSYSFTFTPAVSAVAGTTYTMAGAARSGLEWNHASNVTLTVVRGTQATFTALMNGSAFPSATTAGTAISLSSSGGTGTGAVSYTSLTASVCNVSGTTANMIAIGTCTVQATKALDNQYNAASDTVSVTVNQGAQTITFGALAAKTTTEPPFTVSATGGGSGNPVTFSATGVCSSGGMNGSTISLTAVAGTCMVTANQAGNTNYTAAAPVVQSFNVVDGGSEVFPPNCQVPPGWRTPVSGAFNTWTNVAGAGDASQGVCALKSSPLPLATAGTVNSSQIELAANFNAGNITFTRRVSSEAGWDCLRVYIDDVAQDLGAPNGCFSSNENGNSGEVPYGSISLPIMAGNRIVKFSYETDNVLQIGADAAWIDQVSMPLSTAVNSGAFAVGTFGVPFSFNLTGTNFPLNFGATNLPPGLSINTATGVISGTPSAAGNVAANVSVSNPAGVNPTASDLRSMTFFIGKAGQPINFPAINNKLSSLPSFIVSATGGGSGNPVIFSASGVCSATGTDGTTITLTGALGGCTVSANQAGDSNYEAGVSVQTFQVVAASSEIFPPQCTMPPGWTVPGGSTTGWSVSSNEQSFTGACSLKSNPMADAGTLLQANIQVSGTFAAGTIAFKYKVSSEGNYDCFQFLINGVAQSVGTNGCFSVGLTGDSGQTGWVNASIPLPTPGAYTLTWRYDKDDTCCRDGLDAVWIDDVVLPQFTLTVNAARTASATGSIISTPDAINCAAPATCSAPLSGNVLLTPSPGFLSRLASWSGGGCTGTGPCTVTMDASKTVTATFSPATPPSALQNVVATPGNAGATISFDPPASDGGTPITSYGGNCAASGQTTVFAGGSNQPTPLGFSGMTNGVLYTCTVGAGNFAGSGPTTVVTVTPRTVPSAPTGAMGGADNAQATITFMAPASNGGSGIIEYEASCSASGQTTRTQLGTSLSLTVTALTNGVSYDCSVRARNAAGFSAASNVVSVLPRTVPGAPAITSSSAFDGRVSISFTPPGSDGGSAIVEFEASCSAIGQATRTALGTGTPLVVEMLTNGVAYTCTLRARNAVGFGATASTSFTPSVRPGASLWSEVCTACHVTPPNVPQLNAAGSTATVLNEVIATQPSMSGLPIVTALTQAERVAIAVYLAGTISSAAQTTPFNTPKALDFAAQISIGSLSFETLQVVTPPANGTLSAFTGATITYTPNAGYTGSDSFTFRGSRTNPTPLSGDARTVNLTVLPPPAPVITSGNTASGTNGNAFNYQIVATNSPVSYGASGLPAGLSINPVTGAITGTPTVGGTFTVNLSATNAGGSGNITLTITLNPAAQVITFPAQSPSSRSFAPSPSNTFEIDPLATASSGLAVIYSSKTLSVCTVSGTTITMLAAGTCTLGTNQGGNASFTIAAEVTRDIVITPILPAAPVIGAATPGNLQATIAFTAPTNTGGTGITGYAVSCTPSGSGTGAGSPILVSGLANGTTYTCSATASNSVGAGPASATVTVTPAPTPTAPTIVSAASATFTVNAPGSFTATASGTPSAFTWSATGTLPMGVTFNTGSGVLSGTPTQAGTFPLVIGVTNGVLPNASQMFTLTVAKASQSISFDNPGTRTLGTGTVALAAVATSSLAVTFASDTPATCTVSGSNATLLAVGTCTLRAQQAGNANFNAASDVTQSFTVLQGAQTITFGAQSSPRAFVASSTFALSPAASASSSLAVSYSSLTSSVCTIATATVTVTMVRAGTCTIAANQSGNANFAAAAQVTQSIVLTGALPGAPTLTSATAGDSKITVAFTAPASDGGSSISSYTATCGGVTSSGAGSPLIVSALTNGMSYSCTVTATNATGTGAASNAMMATPAALPGAAIWAARCGTSGCHGSPPNPTSNPAGTRLNVGGNTTALIDYVIPRQAAMNFQLGAGAAMPLSAADRLAVAQYIHEFIPAISLSTPLNTPLALDVSQQVFLNTPIAALTTLEVVTPPANGMLSTFTGTGITYTPNNGFTGSDSFTYRAKNLVAPYDGDIRSVSITVLGAAPAITSALTASATVNTAFSYQIAASNAPSGYSATGLPTGLSVDTSTGVISGMPSAGGSAMVTISASNGNGSGSATLVITVGTIAQTITFGAQASPVVYSQSGVVMIAPTASGGASDNPIVYSSLTPSVCSVSGATFTKLAAGICTIAANQAGNATYSAAAQVTQSVSITGIAAAAPTIGTAAAGNTQATINFTPPSNTGGLPITGYTVNCSSITASGGSSPITVSGLTNGVAYSCTVQATNAAGTSALSGSVMVTPVAIAFTGTVYSRKTHGAIDRDIEINSATPIGGAVDVEPRLIGSGHRIVFAFNNPVTSVTSVVARDASMATVGIASASFNGNELIVTLTGVPDNQRVTVSATGVNNALAVSASVGFLVGDVTRNRAVNASDLSAIRARVGQMVGAGNFQFDLTASNSINAADVSAAKARSGMVLPP